MFSSSNTNDATQFPYPIGNWGELTNDAFGNFYYYYFYNWKVQAKSFECVSDRIPVTVGVSSDSQALPKLGSVLLSPNPTSGAVWVEITGAADLLRILDATGREVLRRKIKGNETFELSLDGLASGIYFVQVQTEPELKTMKLVIE